MILTTHYYAGNSTYKRHLSCSRMKHSLGSKHSPQKTHLIMMHDKTKLRRRRATSPPYLNQNGLQSRPSISRLHSNSLTEPLLVGTEADADGNMSCDPSPTTTTFSLDRYDEPNAEHVIHLSSIEHCMPRAYIRVCLAYRVSSHVDLDRAVANLNNFIRNTVDAKPYLSGYVRPVDKNQSAGVAEIHFTNDDFLNYPNVEVRTLYNEDGEPMDFNELDEQGLPPSRLHPDKVAVLPAIRADETRAPVFRAQANIVKGGLIVSFYLHHCISDGTGLGLLITGAVQEDDFAFKRHLDNTSNKTPCVGERLAAFANRKSVERTKLSWSFHNQTPDRTLAFKRLGQPNGTTPTNPPGRGCVLSIPDAAVHKLRERLMAYLPSVSFSRHDVLQALIWRHMARARMPVVGHLPTAKKSKLLVPVNIRNRLKEPLSDSYFGAAVDFASAEFDLRTLVSSDMEMLAMAAKTIRQAVEKVDEPYIRQSIALARSSDPTIDVRDLLASNMDRVTGADMYITSWERLGLYEAELEMGLGKPEWVRKPWSRDPGSCIILPRNPRKKQFEVVVQMTEPDMMRLLDDDDFLAYVTRVID